MGEVGSSGAYTGRNDPRSVVQRQKSLPYTTGVRSVSYTHLDVYKRQVQHMNVVAKLCLELLDELGDDIQQVLCGSVFIQRSQLIDGFRCV